VTDGAPGRAGLVLGAPGGPVFVDGAVARRVVLLGPVTPVRGLPPELEGVSLAEGHAVTVVRLWGDRRPPREALLCEAAGDLLALRCEVLSSGNFLAVPGGVSYGGGTAMELDVMALYRRIEGALWSEQARQRARRSVDSARARSSQAPAPSSSGRPGS
jgi:hypothetical protein